MFQGLALPAVCERFAAGAGQRGWARLRAGPGAGDGHRAGAGVLRSAAAPRLAPGAAAGEERPPAPCSMFSAFGELGRGFSFSFRSPGSVLEGAGRAGTAPRSAGMLSARFPPSPRWRLLLPRASRWERGSRRSPRFSVPPSRSAGSEDLLVPAAVPRPCVAPLVPAGAGTETLPSQLRGGKHPLGAPLGFMGVPKLICFFAELPVKPLAYLSAVLRA